MSVKVGVEYEGTPNIVPGGRSIPKKPGRGRTNAGSGSKTVVTNTTALGRRTIVLTARMPVGVITNIAGASTTDTALSTINPAFKPTAPSFPGLAADDNDIQWVLAVPLDLANTPNLSIRLHIISQ